uniref:Uncharacterized protein n=1 Tax=Physcomitrium patens TaxID=3218 RepID=A0A2K1JVJ4_PHYPA|nr:hypothetical protein PHYPA_015313 [Physcomitrium patens]
MTHANNMISLCRTQTRRLKIVDTRSDDVNLAEVQNFCY